MKEDLEHSFSMIYFRNFWYILFLSNILTPNYCMGMVTAGNFPGTKGVEFL